MAEETVAGRITMSKILFVEDDEKLCVMVGDLLAHEHYKLEITGSGQDGLHMMLTYGYDLIILDWQLPDLQGIDLCKNFRSRGQQTPILMLTGKRAVEEKEMALDAGADDYLTKPFHPKELMARIRALLRRPPSLVDDVLRFEDLVLDPRKYRVTKSGKDIHLPPREFSLLEFFMRHPGQVFSLEALIDRIWKSDDAVTQESLRVCIRRLRSKIDDDSEHSRINSIYGAGYVLESKNATKLPR
jgi:two-component system, OmpR family, manganese sensing response regulator